MEIKKYESFVNKEGNLISELDFFIDQNKNFFSKYGIEVYIDDEPDFDYKTYVLMNKMGNGISIAKPYNLDNIILSYNITDDENNNFVNDVTINSFKILMKYIFSFLVIGNKNVSPNSLNKYDIKNKHISTENEENLKESNNYPKNQLTTPEISHKLNKKYNWDSKSNIPRSNDKWYGNVYKYEIGIGESDPVKKFKEWSSKYWRDAGTQYDKYEPNNNIIERLKIDENGNLIDDNKYYYKIFVKHKNRGFNYDIVGYATTPQEAIDLVNKWENKLGNDYIVKYTDDGSTVDLNTLEGQEYFFKILKKYNQFGKGVYVMPNTYRYGLPLEAKEDLDLLGIDWYKIETVSNYEHPDFGKKYIEVEWTEMKPVV